MRVLPHKEWEVFGFAGLAALFVDFKGMCRDPRLLTHDTLESTKTLRSNEAVAWQPRARRANRRIKRVYCQRILVASSLLPLGFCVCLVLVLVLCVVVGIQVRLRRKYTLAHAAEERLVPRCLHVLTQR